MHDEVPSSRRLEAALLHRTLDRVARVQPQVRLERRAVRRREAAVLAKELLLGRVRDHVRGQRVLPLEPLFSTETRLQVSGRVHV